MALNKQQDLILNFFKPTKPVTKPENLKGREEILKQGIFYLLRGDSVIIQGSRRIGKTSILHCFNALCSEKNQTCIYISFQSIEKYDSKTFIHYILQKLYSKFKIPQTTEKEDGILSPLRKLGSVIETKLNDEELVIILIDEFQVTEELSEIEKRTFYNQFRNVIDEKAIHNELSRFVFVIATSQSLSELSKGISSTLASAFQKTFVLSTLSNSNCHQLIQTPFSDIAQIKYELVEFVIQESGGHPYLIKLLLYESIIANYPSIFLEFDTDRFKYLVKSQAENIINNLQHSHFRMLLNCLKEFELEILYQVSSNFEKLSLPDIYKAISVKNNFVQFSSVRNALEHVENLRILYNTNNRFSFSNNIYRRWFNLYFRYYYEESALSHKIEKQQELQDKEQKRTQGGAKALYQDKEQYMNNADKQIRILHLSDMHLGTIAQAQRYFTQLATDLTQNLNVKQLNYLVVSGDIANRSTQEEYDAAFELVDKLVKRYGLDPSRIVMVPGNHDLNWELSETSYTFVPKRKLPNPLPEGRYIDAGSAGALICDENEYKKRFDYFSDRFYKKIYSKSYPQEYDQQAIIHICTEDKILFLGLNSCWEIDHEYKARAGIHPNAIANALDQILTGNYDDWLKIAVWHHPVNGSESIKNVAFLEQLAVNGFQLGIHGHIHEAKDENFQYDTRRGLRIIAAGTFGASAREQVTGMPLQYNLLTLDPETGVMTVETRKKEKADGAWSADARWGDKNNPVPRYEIKLRYGTGSKTNNPSNQPKASTQNNSSNPQQSIFGGDIQVGGNFTVGNITQSYHSGTVNQAETLHSKRTILILASSPSNTARLRLDIEVREIDEGLRRAQQREKFSLQQRWAVRTNDLRRALLDFNPQIVHFCGHGSGDRGLVLENDAGNAQLVPTNALVSLFKLFANQGVECVVLNACYAEVQAEAIFQHINYVIGMSDEISDDAALKFAVGFYDALGAGRSYEDAYEFGCNAIALEGIPEELTPVLKKKDQLTTVNSVDVLVEQVRSRIHVDIQRLHGTMPLWGVDHWVPLGDLFVDVNILEQVSSNRRLELDDLWQDFAEGNFNYRSLDRIGLGKKQQRVSGLSVLERNTNLMVVGKPGSGKTTYLQRIITECNDGKIQAQRISILIKLREFVEDGHEYAYNLKQFLGQLWHLSNADIELVLNKGRALVLLDGLDEVTGEVGKQIAKEIKRFARVYPQVQVVVTCRTQTLPNLFDWQSQRFTCVEIADFIEKQVIAFAMHWFRTMCSNASVGEKKAWEFLQLLFRQENTLIGELVITPILLSLTCAVFHQTGKFYSKRSKLYEEGLELLLVQWDKSREVRRNEIYRDLSLERKLNLLSYVAVNKFEQENYVLFDQKELEEYIGEFLKIEQHKSQEVLETIESQHGLLIKRAQKVWSFSHLTFQEYLVAKYFCDQTNWNKLVIQVTKLHWQEVFLLTLGLMANADSLLILIKCQIDKLLSEDNKLQQFLDWLKNKANLINSAYKPASVRAFYFEISLAIVMAPGKVSDGTLADISEDGNLILFLEGAFNLNLSRACESAIRKGGNGNSQLSLDYALVYSLVLSFAFNSNYIYNKRLHDEIYNILNSRLDRAFNNTKNIEIKQLILQIRTQLVLQLKTQLSVQDSVSSTSSLKNDNNSDSTWKEKCQEWTDYLRNILIEHCNVGHDWQLNNMQIQALRQYYYANLTLVYCLNYGYKISNKLREDIEETLLLPTADVEKLKYKK